MNDATALSRPVSPRNTKAAAREAYLAALESPAAADWPAVAALLYAALPVDKVAKSAPCDWPDYSVDRYKKRGGYVIAVTFADGETVRGSFASPPDKPINIGHGMRIAAIFYRARIARRLCTGSIGVGAAPDWIAVPAVVSCRVEKEGETVATYAADLVNEKTAAYRAGSFDRAVVMAEAVARGLPDVDDGGTGVLTVRSFIRAKCRLAAMAFADLEPLNPFSSATPDGEAEYLRWFISADYDDSLRVYLCAIASKDNIARAHVDYQERAADALAFRLDRARLLRDAVETLTPVAAANAAAEFRAPLGDVVALEWHSHLRRRGGRDWKLMLGTLQVGSVYDGSESHTASAAIPTPDGLVDVRVQAPTSAKARKSLERELCTRSIGLFGRAAVAFTEVAAS